MNQKYEAFLKAAQLGSFKAAAEELGYTQAGVSYLIGSLESEMGTVLFERDHAGARLTSDGEQLLPWVQDVVSAEGALATRLDELRHVEGGTVRVAAFSSVAIHWLPTIVDRFLTEHPHVDVQITCIDVQSDLEERLWHGEFDCGFAIDKMQHRFDKLPIEDDPLYIAVAPDHPLAHAGTFPTPALASEPYIKEYTEGPSEMDELFATHGVTPNVRFVINNDYAIMAMVSKGLGFGVFSKLMLDDAPFDLVRLQPEIPSIRKISLVARSFQKTSLATKAFIETVRDFATHKI